jgi:hypothetical protein
MPALWRLSDGFMIWTLSPFANWVNIELMIQSTRIVIRWIQFSMEFIPHS